MVGRRRPLVISGAPPSAFRSPRSTAPTDRVVVVVGGMCECVPCVTIQRSSNRLLVARTPATLPPRRRRRVSRALSSERTLNTCAILKAATVATVITAATTWTTSTHDDEHTARNSVFVKIYAQLAFCCHYNSSSCSLRQQSTRTFFIGSATKQKKTWSSTPNCFFLSSHHFGNRYASRSSPTANRVIYGFHPGH